MLKPHVNSKSSLNVVIIGGSKGFGNALVRGFSNRGHNVLYTTRLAPCIKTTSVGIVNNIANKHDIVKLESAINHHMHDGVDVWINNAAISDSYTMFQDTTIDKIDEIISTNLKGTIMATHCAIKIHAQSKPRSNLRMCHVFNVVGAGSNGSSTPLFSLYGATKAGVQQFTCTLKAELKKEKNIGLHLLSPGMMPTELLVKNASPLQLKMFNVLCEDPDIVAGFVINEITNDIIPNGNLDKDVYYMTPLRIMGNLATFYKRSNRFFRQE